MALFFATHYKSVNIEQASEKVWDVANSGEIEIIDDFFYRWRFCHLIHTDSLAVRRTALLRLQPCFPLGEQMGEDQDLFFRLAEQSYLAYCPLPLTAYRMEVTDSLCAIYQGSRLFSAYVRLEQRAIKRQIPDRLIHSALRLVAEARLSAARRALMTGQRSLSIKLLLLAWRGMVSRRWWLSLVMCVFATADSVKRWERWRSLRNI